MSGNTPAATTPTRSAAGAAPDRILVRGPNWIGDLVMSTPGLHALRRTYPKAHIVVVVPEALAALLDGNDDVDEIWTLEPTARRLRTMRALAKRIARGRFDLGVVIPESISSALVMRWGRIERVVGYARDGLRRVLLHQVVPAKAEWGKRRLVSKERFVLGLMGAVGASGTDVSLRLRVTVQERARLESLLQKRGIEDLENDAPVVLAPGASFGDSKCWPVESYASLADRMIDAGARVVLVGTSGEVARIASVRAHMDRSAIDLGGALDLGMLKALLAGARLLVANDSGARHIAAAFAVPSVIFFGPTSLAKTNENLDRIQVLETEHDCRPCYRRKCPIDHRCLVSISVDEAVLAAHRAVGCAEAGTESARVRGPEPGVRA